MIPPTSRALRRRGVSACRRERRACAPRWAFSPRAPIEWHARRPRPAPGAENGRSGSRGRLAHGHDARMTSKGRELVPRRVVHAGRVVRVNTDRREHVRAFLRERYGRGARPDEIATNADAHERTDIHRPRTLSAPPGPAGKYAASRWQWESIDIEQPFSSLSGNLLARHLARFAPRARRTKRTANPAPTRATTQKTSTGFAPNAMSTHAIRLNGTGHASGAKRARPASVLRARKGRGP